MTICWLCGGELSPTGYCRGCDQYMTVPIFPGEQSRQRYWLAYYEEAFRAMRAGEPL